MADTPHLLSNETARTPLPLSRVDDIVERLHAILDGPIPMYVSRQDLRDVISEIERLRAEIKRLRSVVVLCPRCMEADRG